MTSSPPFSNPPHHIAGIDLGTNTLRLLIVRAESDTQLVAVYSDQVIARLGEGLQHNRILQDSAMDRTIQTLQRWRPILLQHNIKQPIAVATSAVRDAENRDDFLQRVQAEVGFEVEVLSGQEEARRTLVGIAAGLSPSLANILVIDIGGGSTEFISAQDGQSDQLYSTDLGVVRLTERFLTSDPILDDEISAARHFILDRLQMVKSSLGNIGDTILIGTAGTITTLAAMDQELAIYDPRKVHQYWLPLATIQRIRKACVTKTIAERRMMAGLEAGRADVIVAGILILQLTMEDLGFSNLLVSEFGLREGILVDRIQKITGKPVSLELFGRPHRSEGQP
jgi:exopolyphosphatase/guanosine-5'-triphosphate,3'-diphosphate pyrophosphatase